MRQRFKRLNRLSIKTYNTPNYKSLSERLSESQRIKYSKEQKILLKNKFHYYDALYTKNEAIIKAKKLSRDKNIITTVIKFPGYHPQKFGLFSQFLEFPARYEIWGKKKK